MVYTFVQRQMDTHLVSAHIGHANFWGGRSVPQIIVKKEKKIVARRIPVLTSLLRRPMIGQHPICASQLH